MKVINTEKNVTRTVPVKQKRLFLYREDIKTAIIKYLLSLKKIDDHHP